MTTVTIDKSLSTQLSGIEGQVVLCNNDGRALGFFQSLPADVELTELLEPPYTDEEIAASRAVRCGKPLSEILERLGLQ